jgi:uncharacterized protein (TIGR02611 family)
MGISGAGRLPTSLVQRGQWLRGSPELDYRCGGSVGFVQVRTDFPCYSFPSTLRGAKPARAARPASSTKSHPRCVESASPVAASAPIAVFHEKHPLFVPYKWARRIAITVVGFTVLAVGIAMIVLPGPAIVVIPVGLGILGLEFAWARIWLKKIKERGNNLVDTLRQRRTKPP